MALFKTEKQVEADIQPFYTPILFPNGRKQVAEITRDAWLNYRALKDMGVPETRFMRYAKRLQLQTGLPYQICFSMGLSLSPKEFFDGWPGHPFNLGE